MFLLRASLSLLACLAFQACSHTSVPATKTAPAPVADLSLLGDTDVRLLTEAMAYDVVHGPWLSALSESTGDASPKVAMGSIPEEVLPAGVRFPKDTFALSLAQALRNGRRVEVVADESGAEPLWRLDIAAQSEDGPIEGEPSRLYRVVATLRLVPNDAVAWQNVYLVRKRINESVNDAGDAAR